MAKTRTSEKRGVSWLGKPKSLRFNAKVEDFDPSDELRDPEFVKNAILEALSEGDGESVVAIVRAHLRILNRSRAAVQMGVSRQLIHRLIAGSRSPSLPTLGAFMGLLKEEIVAFAAR